MQIVWGDYAAHSLSVGGSPLRDVPRRTARRVLRERVAAFEERVAVLEALLVRNDLALPRQPADLDAIEVWLHRVLRGSTPSHPGEGSLEPRVYAVLYDLALVVADMIFERYPGTRWELDTLASSFSYHRHLVVGYPRCHRSFGVDLDDRIMRHFERTTDTGCSSSLRSLVLADPGAEMAAIEASLGL